VVSLVTPGVELMDAALEGDERLAATLGHPVVPGWATFAEALPHVRDALASDPGGARWGPRLFMAGDPPELVGWGGFKGPPADGAVELGYEIAESRRGRGLATEAVAAMLAEASGAAEVREVVAHTLPEPSASTRVLEKAGFAFDGEAEEDGERVWRFSRPAPTPPRGSPPPR
jgi:[ribosomal protein S5]-alanine N-acetyltransferase